MAKRDPRRRYSETGRFAPPAAGTTPLYRGLLPRQITPQTGYIQHMIVEGDRLDALAQDYYGDPRLWWAIAQANPGLLSPADLVYVETPGAADETLRRIGSEIRIPPKPQVSQ